MQPLTHISCCNSCPREVKFVVANGSKLPSLLKAMPNFEGKLLAVVYWGTAADDAVQVRPGLPAPFGHP